MCILVQLPLKPAALNMSICHKSLKKQNIFSTLGEAMLDLPWSIKVYRCSVSLRFRQTLYSKLQCGLEHFVAACYQSDPSSNSSRHYPSSFFFTSEIIPRLLGITSKTIKGNITFNNKMKRASKVFESRNWMRIKMVIKQHGMADYSCWIDPHKTRLYSTSSHNIDSELFSVSPSSSISLTAGKNESYRDGHSTMTRD